MFVYRREDLPSENEFPADLEKLGYGLKASFTIMTKY